MLENTSTKPRSAAETKARIIAAAQIVFSEKGYPHTGMREIAAKAGVATSLVTKYFKHKAKLFEEALVSAIIAPARLQADRPGFGAAIVSTVLNQELKIHAPMMMALSLGDAEAREIVVRVAKEHILDSMTAWLQPPQAEARAVNILMMTTGFALFSRHMELTGSSTARREMEELFAQSLQRLVDWDR
jgi:AcrR family transcriptional regulator